MLIVSGDDDEKKIKAIQPKYVLLAERHKNGRSIRLVPVEKVL